MKSHIGDVVVVKGEPPLSVNGKRNPYLAYSPPTCKRPNLTVSGLERVKVLKAFKHGEPTDGYTLWHAPVTGGARRLSSPDEVNWETCLIK